MLRHVQTMQSSIGTRRQVGVKMINITIIGYILGVTYPFDTQPSIVRVIYLDKRMHIKLANVFILSVCMPGFFDSSGKLTCATYFLIFRLLAAIWNISLVL